MSQEGKYPDSQNKDSFEEGLEYQDLVMDALAKHGWIIQNYTSKKGQFTKGENRQNWEIKLDKTSETSGRLSIEIAEKTAVDRPWVKSGIYRNDSLLYIHGNRNTIWIFQTYMLKCLHRKTEKDGTKRYQEHTEKTIQGFFLPFTDADQYAILRIDIPKQNGESLPF